MKEKRGGVEGKRLRTVSKVTLTRSISVVTGGVPVQVPGQESGVTLVEWTSRNSKKRRAL